MTTHEVKLYMLGPHDPAFTSMAEDKVRALIDAYRECRLKGRDSVFHMMAGDGRSFTCAASTIIAIVADPAIELIDKRRE